MIKEEFVNGMMMLSGVYVDDRLLGENVLNVWFQFFHEFDGKVFNTAVRKICRECEKRPSVHELLVKCNVVKRELEREEDNRIASMAEEAWTDKELEEAFKEK